MIPERAVKVSMFQPADLRGNGGNPAGRLREQPDGALKTPEADKILRVLAGYSL